MKPSLFHGRNESTVTKSDDMGRVDGLKKHLEFFDGKQRRFAFFDNISRSFRRVSGIDRHDLADHEPVKELADGSMGVRAVRR